MSGPAHHGTPPPGRVFRATVVQVRARIAEAPQGGCAPLLALGSVERLVVVRGTIVAACVAQRRTHVVEEQVAVDPGTYPKLGLWQTPHRPSQDNAPPSFTGCVGVAGVGDGLRQIPNERDERFAVLRGQVETGRRRVVLEVGFLLC